MNLTISKILLVIAVVLFVIGALIAGTVFGSSISAQTFGLWGLVFFSGSMLV